MAHQCRENFPEYVGARIFEGLQCPQEAFGFPPDGAFAAVNQAARWSPLHFWAAKSRRPSLAHQGREGNRPWRPREGRATTPGDPRIWGRPPLVVEKYEPANPRPCKSIRTVRSSKVGESEHDKTFSQNGYGGMMMTMMMMMICLSHGDERTRSR